MLVVHGTKKLLDRLGRPTVEPTTRSTTVLGSWYATVLFWRPQIALLVNERTLLPLLMPLAPTATLLERLPAWLDATLDAHGVLRNFIDAELALAADIGLAKTNNRSVLGVMNEFVHLAHWHKEAVTSDDDLIGVALELSQVPTSPLYKSHVSPDRELAAVVAAAS
jgi:hypothetical protein